MGVQPYPAGLGRVSQNEGNMRRVLIFLLTLTVACSGSEQQEQSEKRISALEEKQRTLQKKISNLEKNVAILKKGAAANSGSGKAGSQGEADALSGESNAELQGDLQRFSALMKSNDKDAVFKAMDIEKSGKLSAVFHTSLGKVECELYPDKAPTTVLNFVSLAEGGHAWIDPRTRTYTKRPLYSGIIFHRVIPGFMIQGGDPLGNGTGGPGYRFADETNNGLKFDREGLLAMANSGPNTNGSQFFITEGKRLPTHLNGKHTIFGACGQMDVVKTIARAKTARRNKPITDVVIERIEIKR